MRSIVLQEMEHGYAETIVRVLAEALGEHSEIPVAPVNSASVLSVEEGWTS